MGRIVAQRLEENSIVAEVEMSKEEVRDLAGEMDDVLMISNKKANMPARISLRGRNEATKYFLIPRALRKNLNTLGSVSCQRIHREDIDVFVYVVKNDTKRQSFLPSENVL